MENPGSCLAFETTTERLLADAKEQEGVGKSQDIPAHQQPDHGLGPAGAGVSQAGGGRGGSGRPAGQVEGGQMGLL